MLRDIGVDYAGATNETHAYVIGYLSSSAIRIMRRHEE